ncbi:hypothetical protein CLF_113028, partial [Clonorchis sinensis]
YAKRISSDESKLYGLNEHSMDAVRNYVDQVQGQAMAGLVSQLFEQESRYAFWSNALEINCSCTYFRPNDCLKSSSYGPINLTGVLHKTTERIQRHLTADKNLYPALNMNPSQTAPTLQACAFLG